MTFFLGKIYFKAQNNLGSVLNMNIDVIIKSRGQHPVLRVYLPQTISPGKWDQAGNLAILNGIILYCR